jgi:hypothetical protein
MFLILEKIGDVTYRLKLPMGAKLHDVFHVGLLKPFKGKPSMETSALPPVLRGKLARGRRALLVQWKGLPAAEATWTNLVDLQHLCPSFHLEDELLAEGRDVMLGVKYQRHKNRTAEK